MALLRDTKRLGFEVLGLQTRASVLRLFGISMVRTLTASNRCRGVAYGGVISVGSVLRPQYHNHI